MLMLMLMGTMSNVRCWGCGFFLEYLPSENRFFEANDPINLCLKLQS